MSERSISELTNTHKGATIYVLGSGASMRFYDPAFFADKIVVGINQTWRDFPCTFVLQHHHEHAQAALDAGQALVISEFDCGIRSLGRRPLTGLRWVYTHPEQRHIDPNFDVWPLAAGVDESLLMTSCTIAEGVQFAARLGAASIVLVGCDGGSLDGDLNYPGYNDGAGTQPEHLGPTYPILLSIVEHFRARGVRIYSLSPFVDFGLEGHTYSKRLAAMALVNVDGAFEICKCCNRVVLPEHVNKAGLCSNCGQPDAHLGAVETHEAEPIAAGLIPAGGVPVVDDEIPVGRMAKDVIR